MTVLGDISKVVDCEHRTAPATEGKTFGYSIGTRAVRNGRISLDVAKPVDEATYLDWTRRAIPVPGDLIFPARRQWVRSVPYLWPSPSVWDSAPCYFVPMMSA